MDNNIRIAGLTYGTETKEFEIQIEPNLSLAKAPVIFEAFMQKSQYTIPKDRSMRWMLLSTK